MRALLKNPSLLFLYVLIYYGKTLFVVLVVANMVLWLAGSSFRLVLLTGALALGVAFFNLGFTVGTLGPPPGRRR